MNIICVEDSLRHLCALQQTTRQIAPEASVYARLNADDAFHHGASRTGMREGRAPAPGQRIYPQTFFLAGVEKGI